MKKLLILAALVLALPLSAQQLWNTTGSTGIIDEGSTALYEFSNQSLQFKAGATGTIVARYPIVSDVQNPGWPSFWVGYAGSGITVQLKQVSQCGNTETVVTTFSGASSPEVNLCISHFFTHTFNFSQNSYYLEVTLTRATTATNPKFHRLQFP